MDMTLRVNDIDGCNVKQVDITSKKLSDNEYLEDNIKRFKEKDWKRVERERERERERQRVRDGHNKKFIM